MSKTKMNPTFLGLVIHTIGVWKDLIMAVLQKKHICFKIWSRTQAKKKRESMNPQVEHNFTNKVLV